MDECSHWSKGEMLANYHLTKYQSLQASVDLTNAIIEDRRAMTFTTGRDLTAQFRTQCEKIHSSHLWPVLIGYHVSSNGGHV